MAAFSIAAPAKVDDPVAAASLVDEYGDEAKSPLDQLLQDLNDDGDLVSLQVLKQKELHDIVEQRALGESVDLTVMLHEYGLCALHTSFITGR